MSISDNNPQTCGQEITIISATPPPLPKNNPNQTVNKIYNNEKHTLWRELLIQYS